MACKTSFELHHNFPKIAEESGFTFNTHKPRVHIDWNRIRLIDIDNLIRDRQFILIEQHLNDILDCVLESEFDVRILDEGVLKIFRLAQLAVEYQQFCRHYLDRSIYVLQEEVTALAQKLDYTKKAIKEKEDEIKKSKRKTRYNFHNPLPYGNDNIAHMILQTLANKSEIFSTTSQIDNVHYNKCKYCDKVFMNQLYLKSHISRRHSNTLGNPQRGLERVQDNNEHSKLQNEITELKLKLKEMEVLIKTFDKHNLNSEAFNNVIVERHSCEENKTTNINNICKSQIQTKDAEVSTNNDGDIFEKIGEWKKEEYEKYNKEINLLRTQIASLVDTYKETDKLKSTLNDNNIMEELHETIKQQNAEIMSLKEELTNSILKSKNEEIDRKKEVEAQIAFWTRQTQVQSEEYKVLLQKLDTVSKLAQESQEIAESERKRATNLQHLLEQNINCEQKLKNNKHNIKTEDLENKNKNDENFIDVVDTCKTSNPVPNRNTLEKLHRRAQELLNQSISSSDTSFASDNVIYLQNGKRKTFSDKNNKKKNNLIHNTDFIQKTVDIDTSQVNTNVQPKRPLKNKSPKKITRSDYKQISPVKVVRAKLTEEVNQRLLSLEVDPLKKSLPYDIYQKHKLKLQEKIELKTKKNPDRGKINHAIMSYLDNKSSATKINNFKNEYISPNRTFKPLRLTSVLSNVKLKALSLVKPNQELKPDERISYDSVSKKALAFLKTPPESTASSPQINKENYDYQSKTKKGLLTNQKNGKELEHNFNKNVRKMQKVSESSEDCDTSTIDSFRLTTESINEVSPGKSISPRSGPQNRRSPTKIHSYVYNKTRRTEINENVQTKQTTKTFEKADVNAKIQKVKSLHNETNSDNAEFVTTENELRNAFSDENINTQKQAKGVLKNASSMSSIYKKKVLFDMDAIQMKSMSDSPSQSVNGRIDEIIEPGSAINPETDEWDISSIENELQNYEKPIKISTRTSAKIAQLKQSIESQLTGRNQNLSSTLVGAVDVLKGPMTTKVLGLGGSNTSLGSSILDDSESTIPHTSVEKP